MGAKGAMGMMPPQMMAMMGKGGLGMMPPQMMGVMGGKGPMVGMPNMGAMGCVRPMGMPQMQAAPLQPQGAQQQPLPGVGMPGQPGAVMSAGPLTASALAA